MSIQIEQAGVSEIFAFLDHVEKRNLLPSSTVSGRRTGVKHVLSTLAEDEPKTVQYLLHNEDSILSRFTNKAKLNFKAASLEEYKSRFRIVMADFRSWSENPSAWERSLASKVKGVKGARKELEKAPTSKSAGGGRTKGPAPSEAISGSNKTSNSRNVPVPLRAGQFEGACVVPIDGLTYAEYQKYGRILAEYIKDEEVRPMRNFAQVEDLTAGTSTHQ